MVESGDGAAVNHRESGPQGARAFVSIMRLDAAGSRRFSGAPQGPEAAFWPGGETSRGLAPDGWMGRSRTADTARTKTRCVCGHQSGVEIALTEHNGEKWSKVGGGRLLSLDRSLRYGCMSYTPPDCTWGIPPRPLQPSSGPEPVVPLHAVGE